MADGVDSAGRRTGVAWQRVMPAQLCCPAAIADKKKFVTLGTALSAVCMPFLHLNAQLQQLMPHPPNLCLAKHVLCTAVVFFDWLKCVSCTVVALFGSDRPNAQHHCNTLAKSILAATLYILPRLTG